MGEFCGGQTESPESTLEGLWSTITNVRGLAECGASTVPPYPAAYTQMAHSDRVCLLQLRMHATMCIQR